MIFVVGAIWLGGIGLIIYYVVRKKKLSWVDMFDPLIIFKFDAKDWGKLLLLALIVVVLFYGNLRA